MSLEVRKNMEVELLAALKQITSPHFNLKASKNKISLLAEKEKFGEIYLQHLTKADGYYAGMEIYTCEAFSFCKNQSPPYQSRLFNTSFLSKSSLSEETKQFGDELGGIIKTPSAQDINATVKKISDRLSLYFLSKAENCILGTTKLIDDVLSEPDSYAFPFLTILFVAHKNNMSLDSDVMRKVLAMKSILGNKKFDLELANKIL
ncbi:MULTISPECIES: hypothetical protein [Pseudomonas]|jgi:hypothetical protein|uniref:Uncharacterized protein n=2 Tax=Pseudomonas TaxID=286 RepID=A0A8I1J7W2_9PSED|nr:MULTISPECIES: hypothetical protein [Pseudomonas]MBB4813346.1 hypothetical protein [Pseudomonas rhodesiae]MBI6622338.1 hypothetical protein [Pseudomonas rhodesiae]MDN6862434.1 hypothetical protein [Pseudomonas rhodesiae]NMY77355.1 hypothetical protein [Pseudomonas rhodesiae]PHN34056.1 hypothetical protein AO259_19875 [Pseudomonas sp. ICMP 564]